MKTLERAFHGSIERNRVFAPIYLNSSYRRYTQVVKERELSYQFYAHFHPYVAQLVNRLVQQSVPGLQAADTEYQRNQDGSWATFDATYQDESKRGKYKPMLHEDFFADMYDPNPKDIKNLVKPSLPVKDLDFTSSGAYAVYNWELFYHIPLTIAINLSKNGRYREAQHWFHYIFDPTDDSDGPTPERFWKVKPFQTTDVKLIEEIIINLSTGEDGKLREDTFNSIMAWKDNPFRPHLVARYRQSAFMFKTVFAYLDNLIAWGDSDFRKDQPEDVDAALLQYVQAAKILGPRPQEVPAKGSVRPQTYANLSQDLSELGNAMRRLETEVLINIAPLPSDAKSDDRFSTIQSLGNALYFCVPRNDKLLGYWDTVADRLFKIRNSLNLQGIFRQLPLFAPPIDPALLAKAAAAGLDISAVVAGLNAPMPLVRFQILLQKATELCQEVKSLGNTLLSTVEKEDNEALALLRARHEKVMLNLTESVKYAQWHEAIKAREGLVVSLQNAVHRYTYYERLLGKQENEIKVPELEELDGDGLLKLKFAAQEPTLNSRSIEVDIAQDLSASHGKLVSSYEAQELEKLAAARDLQDIVQYIRLGGQAISLLPQFGIKFHFWGLGGDAEYGGFNLGKIAQFAADVASALADRKGYEAGNAAKIGGYARREQEWAFQSNTIVGEINQIFKQLRGAQIREAMAEREWKNHKQQIKHAEEVEHFLTEEKVGKKANQAFYAWMKREVRGLYQQYFQFAFDVAKKAERALQQELGDPMLSYLQFGYTGGKEGLLAGEKLYLDLKRMELAYHDLNQREYELMKHVSLLQLDPMALLQLRAVGRCTVKVPEALFDMADPGDYFRRIKTVTVSIPCVVGPYASVNCKLMLTSSTIRKKNLLVDGQYRITGDGDERFETYFGSMQSIVTSSGQNDSGMFESNLRDERKLPFEYSGVISTWELSLPARSEDDIRQFDYDTISDVILHIRYTAREGGELLRRGAMENLRALIGQGEAPGSMRLFSLRHEFPSEWANFTRQKGSPLTLTVEVRPEHFPYWSKGRLEAIRQVQFIRKDNKTDKGIATHNPVGHVEFTSVMNDGSKQTVSGTSFTNIPIAKDIDTFVIKFAFELDDNSMDDLWLAITWGKAE